MRYTITDEHGPTIANLTDYVGFTLNGALDSEGEIRWGVIREVAAFGNAAVSVTLECSGRLSGTFGFVFPTMNPATGLPIRATVLRSREVTRAEYDAHNAAVRAEMASDDAAIDDYVASVLRGGADS